MVLKDLLALDKAGNNPLQRLVDNYWKAELIKPVLSSYPQGSILNNVLLLNWMVCMD